MIYQNDTYTFTLFITHASGTNPSVTVNPVIQIIKMADLSAVLGSPGSMVNLDSTKQLWKYTWSVGSAASGEYVAIVSYAADGNTFTSFPIEKVRIGDSRVIGTVALDSTVAKDATTAKDSTVAKATDLAGVNPNTSSIVLAIKAKTDLIPVGILTASSMQVFGQSVADLYDAEFGQQFIDKSQTPAILTMKRLDNSVLARFQLSDDEVQTSKTVFNEDSPTLPGGGSNFSFGP